MRNALKLFGFIALVAVIGFSMAACPGVDDDGGGGGGGGGGDGSLGNTLTITNAQVYEWNGTTTQYVEFNGTLPDLNYERSYSYDDDDYIYTPLSDLIDGNPSVTLESGKLNIAIGKPRNSSLQNLDTSDFPPGVTVSTRNVKQYSIGYFYNRNGDLVMQRKLDGNTQHFVMYMYVDKAVNITGQYTVTDYYGTVTANYAVYLKAGWNSVIITDNQTGAYTYQRTAKTGTPPSDYRWVINPDRSGGDEGDGDVSVTNVTLNQTSLFLTVGDSEILYETVEPNNATDKRVIWNSSNNNVARVNNGVVTAVAAGTATITVTTMDGGWTAACSVTVTGGDDGGGDGSLGDTLTIINAQVHSMEWNGTTTQYVEFNGTLPDLNYERSYSYDDDDYIYTPLSDLIDGNPSVTLENGKLNITLGKLKASSLQDIGDMPSGVTVSTPDVKQYSIGYFYNRNGDLVMQRKLDGNTQHFVMYMYVDKAVNITGEGTQTGESYTVTYNYAMNLKAGWNSVIVTQTGANTSQMTAKTGTPPSDYRWVIIQTGDSGGGDSGDDD